MSQSTAQAETKSAPEQGVAAVLASLAQRPDGVLEGLADQHKVSYRAVLDCLPDTQGIQAPASAFDAVWQDLTAWGTVMFIVHTANGVFETKASLPPGTHGSGYFNIHGDSPIGGHLKIDRCDGIYFIDRPFFGRRSCSIQFVDRDGDAMFKVFVGRDAERKLNPEQVARFEHLRQTYGKAKAA